MLPIQKKICLLGDFAVGKTSLIRRYVEGKFDDKYLSTIGTKISRKNVHLESGDEARQLSLLIWDLAGGEKFDKFTSSYYRGGAGAIVVCDLTRLDTLQSMVGYIENFLSINPDVPIIIAGNKVDLPEQHLITADTLAQVAERYHSPHFLTSAKTGDNVEALFYALAERIVTVG